MFLFVLTLLHCNAYGARVLHKKSVHKFLPLLFLWINNVKMWTSGPHFAQTHLFLCSISLPCYAHITEQDSIRTRKQ